MEALLENELQTKSGEIVPTTTALANKKIIGLYYSGHYCPPCRTLTPVFSDVYEKIKATNDDFEIVFVSSDKEVAKFNEYYGEMPWLALPYVKRERYLKLREDFGVMYVPTIIFFNDKGEVIEWEGRELIEKHSDDVDYIVAQLRQWL